MSPKLQCRDGKMSKDIKHIGIVKSIENNRVQVLIEQQSACAGCHAKSACMAAEKSEKIIDAITLDPDISVNQKVLVLIKKQLGMKAVLLFYVIPFVLMLATLLVANIYTSNEAFMGILSLIILIPYYILLVMLRSKLSKQFQFYAQKLE